MLYAEYSMLVSCLLHLAALDTEPEAVRPADRLHGHLQQQLLADQRIQLDKQLSAFIRQPKLIITRLINKFSLERCGNSQLKVF